MEFIKSWKFMAIVVAIISIASVAGVVYGVTTHREPGFMGDRIEWQEGDFPLTVCTRTYNIAPGASPEHIEHLRQNIGLINDRLGFSAFVMPGPHAHGVGCQVFVVYDSPIEIGEVAGVEDPGGVAMFLAGTCEVRIANVTGELRSLTVQHELGHCLGLDHDDFNSSIMRREQSPTPAGQYPPRITDHDRSLLREAYAPR